MENFMKMRKTVKKYQEEKIHLFFEMLLEVKST